jgi:pilus assembly protein CpaB
MKKPIVFFVLAGFAAVLASMVVYSALKRKETEVEQARVKTVEVAVAAHELGLGTKIDAAGVKMVRWPREAMPVGASSDPRAFLGSVIKVAFVENEPLVASKLFSGEKTAGVLPLLIPAGMRAMSVPVDEVGDIAGFVLPHARVDVLVALSEAGGGGGSGGNRAKIILENIEVLAVAQTIEQKQDEPRVVKVVTLLVTPEEAERLALASHEGGLRLAMRNYNDSKIVLTPGIDVPGVLKAYSNRPLPAPQLQAAAGRGPRHAVVRPPRPVEVEVMRNGQSREAIEFINDAARARPAPAAPAAAPGAAPAAPPPSAAAAPASDAPTTMGTASDHGKSAAAAFMPVVEADPCSGAQKQDD